MSLDDLGRPYDEDFQRLQGPAGATLFPDAAPPTNTLQARIDHQFVAADTEEVLAANASAWTLSVSATTSSKHRYASYRAYQVDRVHTVDDTTKMRRSSANAVYYPWRIYVGYRYEVLFEGGGEAWDLDGSAPDVMPELRIGLSYVARRSRKHQDTSRHTWRVEPPMPASPGTELSLQATDVDLASFDRWIGLLGRPHQRVVSLWRELAPDRLAYAADTSKTSRAARSRTGGAGRSVLHGLEARLCLRSERCYISSA